MKTSQKIMIVSYLIFIGLIVFSCGSNEKIAEEKERTIKPKLTGTEDVIDLERHVVNAGYGNTRMMLSKFSIHVSKRPVLPELLGSIHKNGVKSLKTLARDIEPGYTGRYLLAVRIIYGLNEAKDNMKLYYQPVLFKNITNGTKKDTVYYQPVISPTVYKFSPNTSPYFFSVTQETVTAAVSNYTLNMTFKKEDDSYRPFKNTAESDSTGDVLSVIYPIQEMDSIMSGNDAEEIHIFNAAEIMYVSSVPYIKHSVLLGHAKILKGKESYLFQMKYGNLSHLCPPSCSTAKKFSIK